VNIVRAAPPRRDARNPEEDRQRSESTWKTYYVQEQRMTFRCERCGAKFNKAKNIVYRAVGGAAGAVAGALLGSKIGLALGPLGAVAGTIPGAIVGALVGQGAGGVAAYAKCPTCDKLHLLG